MGGSKVRVRGRLQWRARVRIGGVTKTAYRRRRDEALEAEQQLRKTLAGEHVPTRREESITFAEHWNEYLRDAAATTNKPSTLREKRSAYRNHLGPYFGPMPLRSIGVRVIDRFRAQLLGKVSPKTTNNILAVLRHSLVIAARWERIPAVPHLEFARAVQPPIRFLDFEEALRLREGAREDPMGSAMITLALNTGLRIGELRALPWDAVDLKAGRLHVRQAASRNEVETPKSGRSREVPLNETARAALTRWRHLRGPFVFCKDDGRMLTRHEADTVLRRAQRRAQLGGFSWHALRHTFASHLVMRGVPLKSVQELLGHASIEMTMRYAHLSPAINRDAVRALDAPGGDTSGDSFGPTTRIGS